MWAIVTTTVVGTMALVALLVGAMLYMQTPTARSTSDGTLDMALASGIGVTASQNAVDATANEHELQFELEEVSPEPQTQPEADTTVNFSDGCVPVTISAIPVADVTHEVYEGSI